MQTDIARYVRQIKSSYEFESCKIISSQQLTKVEVTKDYLFVATSTLVCYGLALLARLTSSCHELTESRARKYDITVMTRCIHLENISKIKFK